LIFTAHSTTTHLDVGEGFSVGKVFQSAGSKASEVGRELGEPKPREESLLDAKTQQHTKKSVLCAKEMNYVSWSIGQLST
jgi:hypothetical protein